MKSGSRGGGGYPPLLLRLSAVLPHPRPLPQGHMDCRHLTGTTRGQQPSPGPDPRAPRRWRLCICETMMNGPWRCDLPAANSHHTTTDAIQWVTSRHLWAVRMRTMRRGIETCQNKAENPFPHRTNPLPPPPSDDLRICTPGPPLRGRCARHSPSFFFGPAGIALPGPRTRHGHVALLEANRGEGCANTDGPSTNAEYVCVNSIPGKACHICSSTLLRRGRLVSYASDQAHPRISMMHHHRSVTDQWSLVVLQLLGQSPASQIRH